MIITVALSAARAHIACSLREYCTRHTSNCTREGHVADALVSRLLSARPTPLRRARSIITSRTMKLPQAYDVLGVQEGATIEEAKRAYKKLALLHHPDRSQDPDATEKMQRISEPRAL